MSTRTINKPEADLTDVETGQARELAHALAGQKLAHGKVQLRIDKKNVAVPERAIALIALIMEKMGAGDFVEVRTLHDTLSTTEAAEILNVSRPYVVKFKDDKVTEHNARFPRALALMYLDWQDWGLRPLNGIASTPLLRADGSINSTNGYDAETGFWLEGARDLTQFVPDTPSGSPRLI